MGQTMVSAPPSAARTAVVPEKPLLRGVSHEIAAFAALAAWIGLVAVAAPGPARAAASVYGATLLALFTISALYHRPTWTPRTRLFWRRLDHSAIFLLIAGTYTPFCLLLGGRTGNLLLCVIWAGAALGIVQAVVWPTAPKPLIAVIYVVLGWVVVPVLPALLQALGLPTIALLGAGGVAYSVGAVVYALRRPDPFPRVFGYHEVFHALVVLAAVLHFVVAARAILALS
jgi:hemolysin III